MSQENDNSLNGQSGEISTIREILMGSHLGAYEQRFIAIENRLTALEEKLMQTNEQTGQNIEKLNVALQADYSARLDKLEAHFKETNQNDKQELSKLFSDISNRLMK